MQRQFHLAILTPRLAGLPAAVPATLLSLSLAIPLAAASPLDGMPEGEAAQGPKVVVPKPLADFGTVAKGARLSHDFLLQNQGSENLEIFRVVPACGCTAAEFDRVILPGGEGRIHAVVDTRSMIGPTERTLTVYTNDPGSPRLTLSFKAVVKPYLRSSPGYVRYRAVRGEPAPGAVVQTIWAEDGSDFEVISVDSPYPFLTATFHRASEEERHTETKATGPQWVVELNLHPEQAPIGPLAQELVVHTDHEVQKELRIPVTGSVRPAIWATPDEVDLGEVKLPERSGFVVVVQNLLSQPVEITGVDSDIVGLVPSYAPLQEGRKYAVEVLFDANMPEGPFDGTLKIRTSSSKMPVVEVPVRGTVL